MTNTHTNEQIIAIKTGWLLARTLQVEHPEIADMYRGGKSHTQIVRELNIGEKYDVKDRIAVVAVGHAIAGHTEGYRIEALEGLITDKEELKRLAEEHNRSSGVEWGYKMLREGTGVHAMHYEKRRATGKKSAVTRGQVPWKARTDNYGLVDGERQHNLTTLSEEEYLVRMYNSDIYLHTSGKNKGRRKILSIRDDLNAIYHKGKPVRTLVAIKRKIHKIIRKGK